MGDKNAPTPWFERGWSHSGDGVPIFSGRGLRVAVAVYLGGTEQAKTNAALIVRAVNHDHLFGELVEALTRIKAFPKAAGQTGHGGDYQAGLELAAAYATVALAKVEASDG